ncbi:MAG: hypothetical protein ACYDDE_00645 [bacterium]
MDLNDKNKELYIPNWYEKSHFEDMLDIKLSNKAFQKIKEYLVDTAGDVIADDISELIKTELRYAIAENPNLVK